MMFPFNKTSATGQSLIIIPWFAEHSPQSLRLIFNGEMINFAIEQK